MNALIKNYIPKYKNKIDEILLYENNEPKLFTVKNGSMLFSEDHYTYLYFLTKNKDNKKVHLEILLSNENLEKLKQSQITIYDCFKKYAETFSFEQVWIVDFDKNCILESHHMSDIEDYLLFDAKVKLKEVI